MNTAVFWLCAGLTAFKHRFLKEERGDVNIVSIVVLIGIAVLLAVVFKNQIINLLDVLFNAITGTATNAVTGE